MSREGSRLDLCSLVNAPGGLPQPLAPAPSLPVPAPSAGSQSTDDSYGSSVHFFTPVSVLRGLVHLTLTTWPSSSCYPPVQTRKWKHREVEQATAQGRTARQRGPGHTHKIQPAEAGLSRPPAHRLTGPSPIY